jgi:hypothetical protein
MDLFQQVEFISHAGIPMTWKIEMDALTDAEWAACAKMVMEYQKRPFYKAVGIPRGGVKFANALNKYASGDPNDEVMVVDDVTLLVQVSVNLLQRTILCGQCNKVFVGACLLANQVIHEKVDL